MRFREHIIARSVAIRLTAQEFPTSLQNVSMNNNEDMMIIEASKAEEPLFYSVSCQYDLILNNWERYLNETQN